MSRDGRRRAGRLRSFRGGSSCAYIPIGLFNRFDQAPENGAHCGEYRIVYAKQSGVASTSDRNLLIFEAVLPNPHPQQGLKGCQQIVDTWADLPRRQRAGAAHDVLEDFYFDGQGSVGPVISDRQLRQTTRFGAGQIRTNQFVNTTTGWSLREFKLPRTCSGGTCTAPRFTPVTNKNNAYGPLFAPASHAARRRRVRDVLSVSGARGWPRAACRRSTSASPTPSTPARAKPPGTTAAEMRYPEQLGTEPSRCATASDRSSRRWAARSRRTTSSLRAQALTCAGCHRLNNNVALGGGLTWPASLGFTHVTERETEVVGGEDALPHLGRADQRSFCRPKAIFEDFLNDRPRPSKGPTHPLSGSRTHG